MIDAVAYIHRLQDEAALLTKELTELGVENAARTDDWIAVPEKNFYADENVRADRSEDWIERQGEVSALETRLANVHRALDKITSGTYGACEVCAAPISEERLNANPAARTCQEHFDQEDQLA